MALVEARHDLIVVGGTWDHTDEAEAFYGDVVDVFTAAGFNTRAFRPLWNTRPGGSIDVVHDMMEEIGVMADEMARDRVPDGAVERMLDGVELIDERALNGEVKTSLLGLSVGGTLALNTLIDSPARYHRAFALGARTNEEGLSGLREINPAGATTVEVFSINRGSLEELGLVNRVATGLRVGGDNRVSPSAASIPNVRHVDFHGVPKDHVRSVGSIATNIVHAQPIVDFLVAA